MRTFLDERFLLGSDAAERLYREYAADMPIVDYHCHLPPSQLARPTGFSGITPLWLGGDHYKWRAMRALGVSEELITGKASDWDKFAAWAASVPETVRNPLYHWTHMELRRPFGITDLLNPSTARSVYEACNEQIAAPGFTTWSILQEFDVRVVCTSDDPTDDLAHHRQAKSECDAGNAPCVVLPVFRADTALAVHDPRSYNSWLERLESAVDREIRNFSELCDALTDRHRAFEELGCRLADYGIEQVPASDFTPDEANRAFRLIRSGSRPSPTEANTLASAILHHLARLHHEAGWAQQLHLGSLRHNNTRMEAVLGPATGYDGMGDLEHGKGLIGFLDRLDRENTLAKTILFSLNPRDHDMLAAIAGSFQEGPVRGKIQCGPAWWFNDHERGMTLQMNALSDIGLLSTFIGMVTDSRSFLSMTRHDYFRRLLCNIIGSDIESGRLPADWTLLGGMVRNICFHNAVAYLDLDRDIAQMATRRGKQ